MEPWEAAELAVYEKVGLKEVEDIALDRNSLKEMQQLVELQDERSTTVAGDVVHSKPDEDAPIDIADVQMLAGRMGITFQADLVDADADLSEALVDQALAAGKSQEEIAQALA